MKNSHCEHKTPDEIRDLIREEAEKIGGIPVWCKLKGVGTSYIYEVLRGMREPSAMVMNKIGYRRVILGEPVKQTKEQRN